jgi:hypothetical protein
MRRRFSLFQACADTTPQLVGQRLVVDDAVLPLLPGSLYLSLSLTRFPPFFSLLRNSPGGRNRRGRPCSPARPDAQLANDLGDDREPTRVPEGDQEILRIFPAWPSSPTNPAGEQRYFPALVSVEYSKPDIVCCLVNL